MPRRSGHRAIASRKTRLQFEMRTFIDFLVGHFGEPPYWDEWEAAPRKAATKREASGSA